MFERLFVLAAEGDGVTLIDKTSIQQFLIVLAGLALMWVGISAVAASKRSRPEETMKIAANGMMGMVLVAMGAGAVGIVAFGKEILILLGIA